MGVSAVSRPIWPRYVCPKDLSFFSSVSLDCGNAILYDYGTGAVCNTPCPGDASNTCGGSLALQIYSTGAGPYTTGPAAFVVEYNGYKATECWEWVFFSRFNRISFC